MDQSPSYNYQLQPQPGLPNKRVLIFGIIILALLLIAVSILALKKSTTIACISPSDYQSFYGETPLDSHFDPKTSFFSKAYIFEPASSTLNNDESDSPVIDAGKLAHFYTTHQDKPMIFTVSTAYDNEASETTKPVAEQRAAFLVDTLKKAGIPETAITQDITAYSTSDEGQPDGIDTAAINLASVKNCQE